MAFLVLLDTLGTAAVSGDLTARVRFLVPLGGAGESGCSLAALGMVVEVAGAGLVRAGPRW